MRQMRTELRRTLQWCMDQPEAFTVKQCAQRIERNHASVGNQFHTLMFLGLLGRTIANQNRHLYWIKDDAAANNALNCAPVKTVPVDKRRGNVKQAAPRRVINSVFALGA